MIINQELPASYEIVAQPLQNWWSYYVQQKVPRYLIDTSIDSHVIDYTVAAVKKAWKTGFEGN